MRDRHSKNSRCRRGFTLAEVLVAVLILLLVTAVVAAGIPVAANVYGKVVDAANAQVFLSTTVTRLRDELSTASDVSCEGTEIAFTSQGHRSVLSLATQDGLEIISLQEYADVGGGVSRPLVSREAANKTFSITYEEPAYADGVVTIPGLTVSKDGQTLASLETFQVRVLTDAA